MQAINLTAFGLEHLEVVNLDTPAPGAHEVLVRFEAASVNPRDLQILTGQFTPNVSLPLVPLSDGAGIVEAIGEGVERVAVGDRVTPTFFPNWLHGEALGEERAISSGLEAPGVLREYGVYHQDAVVRAAPHLTAHEAACLPCAGLTAWSALVDRSAIKAGNTVLVQGTGGVALAALQIAKALGAKVIIISSSDERLERAAYLGADHGINYAKTPDWGPLAREMSGVGVDAVVEIGGAGTIQNSLAAIRHGGHINIIGYMAGVEMDITVFPLIIRNANLHGIGTGNRDSYEAYMDFVGEHILRPEIHESFPMSNVRQALAQLGEGGHMGKLTLSIS